MSTRYARTATSSLVRRDHLRRGLISAPGVAWLLLFVLLPLCIIAVYSVARRGVYGGVELAFTWENYVRLFDPLYLAILWRSVTLAFWTTLLCLAAGFPLAYAIATAPAKWKNALLLLVIIPFWTNFLIRTYAWIILLRSEGLINATLQALGLIDQPLELLYTPTAVLLGFVYNWLPFMVLPLYASLEKLDRSLIEAAEDLGARGFQITRKVVLPLALPGIASGSMLVFIPALAMFVIPDLMGGGRSILIGNLIKNQFLTARNWPFGSAASVLLIVATLLALLLYAKAVRFTGEEENP